MFNYQTTFLTLITCIQFVTANKFNISFSDLATCEEYTIHSKGYTYADFFQVNSLRYNGSLDNERLHLKLYVMTTMDAHILLSETDHPRNSDRVYEIVLGAGGNTFSVIRETMTRQQVALTLAQNLLSLFDPTPVEIIQTNDGELIVNIPGYANPFLNYTDVSPLNVRYISFSSYGKSSAKWYYDCRFDGLPTEMQMETRSLSNEERLAADILANGDGDLAPGNIPDIQFSFQVRSVEFDQHSSILSTRLHILMTWMDDRLKWDPSEYGDVKFIVQPMFKVWHPVLHIKDGAQNTFKRFRPFYSIRIDYDGSVTQFARNAEISSWCFDISKYWPNDVSNCEIVLETRDPNIQLKYDAKSPLTDQNINELSQWSLEKVSVLYSTYETEMNVTPSRYLETVADDLKIQLVIKRNSAFYHCVFTSPALVAELLILLSFFLENNRRGGLNLVAILVICLAFMFIAKHAPSTIVPYIVIVYQILLGFATGTYLLHIVTIWLEQYPPKHQPHQFLINVINCSTLRFILAMRFRDSAAYISAQEYPWLEISLILNRVFFIIITLNFVYVNCLI